LPIVLEGECVGSVTETRLMAQVIEDPSLLDVPVETVMGSPFPVVDAYVDAQEVRHLLTRENAACLVRENGSLSGIITRYDVIRALTA
jgi:cystathionine beta-synthase